MKDRHGSTLEKGDHVRGQEHGGEVYKITRVETFAGGAFLVLGELEGLVLPNEVERVVEDAEGNWIGVGDEVEYTGGGRLRIERFCRGTEADHHDRAVWFDDGCWGTPGRLVLVEPELSEDARKALAGIQVYVAGPYSEGDLEQNIRQVIFAGEVLTERGRRQGHHVAPWIPHLNKLWHDEVPHEYEFWLDLDFVHLANSDACFRVGGHSPGADRERAVCDELGIPFFTCLAEYEEWLDTK